MSVQNLQLTSAESEPIFPSTRFQGSKLKIINWIWDSIKDLKFDTALDAFGGAGSVAFMLKQNGKSVTYNDILKFNWVIGLALIENDSVKLSDEDIDFLLTEHPEICYPTFIQDTFKGIYFTDEENKWIDRVVTNISLLPDPFKKALGYFALFQACIIKRPFNLFHRNNLYLRQSEVKRNFGNKSTWDTPFEIHFIKFVNEANKGVFSNGRKNNALNFDVFEIENKYDLVYIDTPYINKNGVGTDYHNFYHFLEGLVNYHEWKDLIDFNTKNRRLYARDCPWTDKKRIHDSFNKLFNLYKDSILVVSYRSDGIPSVEDLETILKRYKSNVKEVKRKSYKYALSNNQSEEILLIGY
jgi:adenine-specific DNA methylase